MLIQCQREGQNTSAKRTIFQEQRVRVRMLLCCFHERDPQVQMPDVRQFGAGSCCCRSFALQRAQHVAVASKMRVVSVSGSCCSPHTLCLFATSGQTQACLCPGCWAVDSGVLAQRKAHAK